MASGTSGRPQNDYRRLVDAVVAAARRQRHRRPEASPNALGGSHALRRLPVGLHTRDLDEALNAAGSVASIMTPVDVEAASEDELYGFQHSLIDVIRYRRRRLRLTERMTNSCECAYWAGGSRMRGSKPFSSASSRRP